MRVNKVNFTTHLFVCSPVIDSQACSQCFQAKIWDVEIFNVSYGWTIIPFTLNFFTDIK